MARLYTAKGAAAALGRPALARTLTRRAAEAHREGDEAVQRVADRWIAPLPWWEENAHLRPPGRKRRPALHNTT